MRTIFGFFLIFFSLLLVPDTVYSQSNDDYFIDLNGDTTNCNITLVNDQNIFFTVYNRNSKNSDFISLGQIKAYYINNTIQENNSSSQEIVRIPYNSIEKWICGIKLSQQVNLPIYHTSLLFSLYKKNHNLYFGPQYTLYSNNFFGTDIIKDSYNHAYGINLGYRYLIDTRWTSTNFFTQIDFSLYNANYKYYAGRYTGVISTEDLIIENCVSFGINYKATNFLELFFGLGFGSTGYFFLNVDGFIIHSVFGIEYKIPAKQITP